MCMGRWVDGCRGGGFHGGWGWWVVKLHCKAQLCSGTKGAYVVPPTDMSIHTPKHVRIKFYTWTELLKINCLSGGLLVSETTIWRGVILQHSPKRQKQLLLDFLKGPDPLRCVVVGECCRTLLPADHEEKQMTAALDSSMEFLRYRDNISLSSDHNMPT